MANFTRDNLYKIVRNHEVVELVSNYDQQKIKNAVHGLMTSLVARGLVYNDRTKTGEAGRAEHEYAASNLYPRLYRFTEKLRENSVMWSVAHAILDHLEFLGYKYDGEHFVVPDKKISAGDAAYINIFGREAFEKRKAEENKTEESPWLKITEEAE